MLYCYNTPITDIILSEERRISIEPTKLYNMLLVYTFTEKLNSFNNDSIYVSLYGNISEIEIR